MLEFIKWCFRDENSGFTTIIVIWAVCLGTAEIIQSFKNKK